MHQQAAAAVDLITGRRRYGNDFADCSDRADPDGCLAILMNNQNEENFPLTQSVEEQSCATLIPLMETEDAAFLTQTDECWQENIDWMLENQLIDKAVDVSDVMTIVDFEN